VGGAAMAGDPAAAAAAVGAMRPWNYVVTAHKLTVVARSCVGNFTAPDHLDLSKFTRIEIGVSAYSSGSSGQTDLPRPEYVPSVWTYLLLWTANNCALLLASIVEKVFFKVIHNGYCCSDKCWYTFSWQVRICPGRSTGYMIFLQL
jgi:hypothetical protein